MARIKLAVAAALTSLALAAPAVADEIDVRAMDQVCRTDPAYVDRCFIIPESYASSVTLWEYAVARAKPHDGDPELTMDFIIQLNGWHGATKDTVIPAGVAFRTA